ncbi:hypothetical protein FACS189443_2930 [Planctomycetales bacterium]|nr:hypothetical protein FACS189443_2930 [Planctomycetales bacterium]
MKKETIEATETPKKLNSRERFREDFKRMVCIGCSGLYIESPEVTLITEDVGMVGEQNLVFCWRWDFGRGLTPIGNAMKMLSLDPSTEDECKKIIQQTVDPSAAILAFEMLQ